MVGVLCGVAPRPVLADSPRDESPKEAPVVVIVGSKSDGPVVALLRAELRDLGLRVVDESARGEVPFDFRVVVAPTRLEVWSADRSTGAVTLREVFAEANGAPIEPRTAVLHVVELLRWHTRGQGPASRSEPPRPSSPKAPAAPPAPRSELRLTILPEALYSPGGTSPGYGVKLDVLQRWGTLGVRLAGSTLLVPNQRAEPEGTAEVTPWVVSLQAAWVSRRVHDDVGSELGAGIALVSTRLRATSNEAYLAHEDHLLTAAPVLDGRLHYALSETLALALGGALLFPFRSDRIQFGEREVAHHGRLLGTLGLGIAVTVR
jgi:hypothetical protein